MHSSTGDHVILIFDGTYIFVEKSGNFSFQRATFSGHKHQNLIKPMLAVCPDGFIAAVWGGYPGSINDASIMSEILQKNIWTNLQVGDVFIVDRGFRDSIADINAKGFVGKMPAFLNTPSSAFTTEQANKSRCITKIRYIVEVVNGRLKEWFSYFDKTIENTALPYLFIDFKIACFLHNIVFKPIQSSSIDIEIANRMILFANRKNNLSQLVKHLNLNAKMVVFEQLELSDLTFPELTMHDLCLYTCGSYQIKMAASYYQDHVIKNGDFEFQVAKENLKPNYSKYNIKIKTRNSILIKARIRSRFSNATKYFVFVLIDKTKNNIDGIIGHTCSCKVGKRVVGCCSHVATIIWFFGYARHQQKIPMPANYLDNYFSEALHNNELIDQEIESGEEDEG